MLLTTNAKKYNRTIGRKEQQKRGKKRVTLTLSSLRSSGLITVYPAPAASTPEWRDPSPAHDVQLVQALQGLRLHLILIDHSFHVLWHVLRISWRSCEPQRGSARTGVGEAPYTVLRFRYYLRTLCDITSEGALVR